MRSDESFATTLGDILRRARQAQSLTLEDAEQTTRISRRYLEALEQEQFGVLPAPVYARGFLRTYASFLGLDPGQLLPLFPVGYRDQPLMEPLPRLERPPAWSPNWLVAGGAVGVLVLIIALLYAFAGGESSLLGPTAIPVEEASAPAQATSPAEGREAPLVQGGALPNLRGRSVGQAVELLEQMGLSYFILETSIDGAAADVVAQQSPAPGTQLGVGQVVTLVVSSSRR